MTRIHRRRFLQSAGACAAGLSFGGRFAWADSPDPEGMLKYPFALPKLPYAFDALEPHIDAETMKIHHDKHHQAYVDNLNKALANQAELQKQSLLELLRDVKKLPEAVGTAVRNNGGGHLNHSMFWHMMAKKGGKPSGELAAAIDQAFGSFDKFQEKFSGAGLTRFGSGWAWLVAGRNKLEVVSTPNQDTPAMEGRVPILGLDVWEHAYYLKYQNRRGDYIKAWWNVVNWEDVAARYAASRKGA
jgi:Fe-Mn family superoxide dismutase